MMSTVVGTDGGMNVMDEMGVVNGRWGVGASEAMGGVAKEAVAQIVGGGVEEVGVAVGVGLVAGECFEDGLDAVVFGAFYA